MGPEMDTKTDRLVRTLRLRHLELLVALAETPTMRGAAAPLHLSQPAISKMLGELESAFAARLFERRHQGIHANALGTSAAFRARAVLHELARATADVDALQRGITAVLRVGAPSVLAAIPPELSSSHLIPLPEPVVLLKDELCVLPSVSNPGVNARRLQWADLRAAQWVLPPKETLVRQAFMTVFLNSGVAPPVPVIEAMSSVTIGTVLRKNPSLPCAVRLGHALDEVARGGVQRLKVGPQVVLPSFGLFFRRDGMARPAILMEFAN